MTAERPDREQDIRARAEAASSGTWGTRRDLNGTYTIECGTRVTLQEGFASDGDVAVLCGDETTAYRNSEFIARARADIPWLLDRIAALEADRDGAVAAFARERREGGQVAVADVVAWLNKKAREYDAIPKSRRENPTDWLLRLASKAQRGAIRPAADQAPEASR
jgi:hypothetical protein